MVDMTWTPIAVWSPKTFASLVALSRSYFEHNMLVGGVSKGLLGDFNGLLLLAL